MAGLWLHPVERALVESSLSSHHEKAVNYTVVREQGISG